MYLVYTVLYFLPLVNMISLQFMTRLKYTIYAVAGILSLISPSVQALPADGVFGRYFENMTTPCAPLSVLT